MSDLKPNKDSPDIPETIATYLRLRKITGVRVKRRRSARSGESEPFMPGRDPHGIADVIDQVVKDSGWSPTLSQFDVVLQWPEIVGADTAAHTKVETFNGGVLVVRADSTAWAKQLQLMRGRILDLVQSEYPDAGVESIRFLGPDVPSFKRGPRTVPGRGVRDTYG